MAIKPLGYRTLEAPGRDKLLRFWPIARVGMTLVLKRKTFRIFLLFSLLSFLFASTMIYLKAQLEGALGQKVPVDGGPDFLFTGTGTAYHKFLLLQKTVVMVMLGLAGGLLVGGDFRSNALPFYLSRPISKLDYFLGKLAATAGLAALITLVPAVVLFVEYGAFTESFDYYRENLAILGAIAGYGSLVAVVPAVLLLGLASLLKKTVPILIVWGGLFVFIPAAAHLVEALSREAGWSESWRWQVLDLWTDLEWIANMLFGIDTEVYAGRWPYAAAALGAASFASVFIFWRRVSAVEVVR